MPGLWKLPHFQTQTHALLRLLLLFLSTGQVDVIPRIQYQYFLYTLGSTLANKGL